MSNYHFKHSIAIAAKPSKVWDALTNPKMIKQYLFGTDAISDWKEGSDLFFQGEFDGTTYRDKGKILVLSSEKEFKYSYFSSFSGLEDRIENYNIISFKLFETEAGTDLKLSQENIASEDAREHSKKNWELVLNNMKDLIEK